MPHKPPSTGQPAGEGDRDEPPAEAGPPPPGLGPRAVMVLVLAVVAGAELGVYVLADRLLEPWAANAVAWGGILLIVLALGLGFGRSKGER